MIPVNSPLHPLALNSFNDRVSCLRPNFARGVTETLQQSAILSENDADPVIRQPSVRREAFDNLEDSGLHAGSFARLSVQVNARHNVNALNAAACYRHRMENGWFDRLVEMIEADGRSKLALSIAANCGRNFIQQMIKDGKEPGSDKLVRILEVLGSRASLYVFTGLDLADEDRDLLKLLSRMDPEAKREAVKLFQRLQSGEAA